MKTLDEILESARYFSQTSSFLYDPATGVYTSGVSSELFINAVNSAQNHLQAKIILQGSELFLTDENISLVGAQSGYSMTKRVLGSTGIKNVYYNRDSALNPEGWGVPFRKGIPRDRRFTTGEPCYYIGMAGKVEVAPIPDSSVGVIKVCFIEELDDLDIKRGKVSGLPAGVSIVLAAAAPVPDQYKLQTSSHICISDVNGNVMLRNGQISSYTPGTLTIALAANVSTYLVSPYTLANLTNGFVTCGKNTTTISKLPDQCEEYLQVYMQKRAMTGNSDSGSLEEDVELKTIEERILSFYGDENKDVDEFPIIDEEILD